MNPVSYEIEGECAADRLALIRRLCVLQAKVADEALHFEHSADCICLTVEADETPLPPTWSWSNSGKAVEFIEQAVQEKLDRDRQGIDLAAMTVREAIARLAVKNGVTVEDLQGAMA